MGNCGAIILAAGKGTRMKSEKAKVVFRLADKEMVRRVTETALSLSCDPIGIVVGYQKESVIQSVPSDSKITFIEQKEQHGTGHAVKVCAGLFEDFDGDMFILCGDIPLLSRQTLQRLLKTHQENNAACTVLTIKLTDPASYGRIVRNPEGEVERIVEFKDASEEERKISEINTGIYCFNSKLLFSSLQKISNDNKQQEYYLTDTLEILNGMNERVVGMVTDDKIEVTGINSQKELAKLESDYYDRIKDHWLTHGVSIEHPASVIIGDDVIIEPDTEIGAGTIIKGRSRIRKGSAIGSYCFIDDADIGENVTMEGYNIVKKAKIEADSRLSFQEMWLND